MRRAGDRPAGARIGRSQRRPSVRCSSNDCLTCVNGVGTRWVCPPCPTRPSARGTASLGVGGARPSEPRFGTISCGEKPDATSGCRGEESRPCEWGAWMNHCFGRAYEGMRPAFGTSYVLPALAILGALSPASCGARTGLGASETPEVAHDASVATDAGISNDASLCDHVVTTTYECGALPLKEGTCPGGPPPAGTDGADASYPLGCLARVPSCDPSSPGEPLVCKCTILEMAPFWTCGL